VDYSVRQVGEWPLETTIIHEERYTRGMTGVMMSLSRCPSKMPPPLGRNRKTSKGAGKSPAVENFARQPGNGAHDAAADAAGRERETRSKRAGKSTSVEDFARYSVEDAQDAAAAGKEGDKEGRRCQGGGDKG